MNKFRLQYLRCFLPTFRFFNSYDGNLVFYCKSRSDEWRVLESPAVRLRFWHLFLNPVGNLILWEETLFRALLQNPGDSALRVRALSVLSGRCESSEFRVVLESPKGEVMSEVHFIGEELN